MNTTLKIVGILDCLLVMAGAILKVLHIKGSGYLLPVGVAMFFFYLAVRARAKSN